MSRPWWAHRRKWRWIVARTLDRRPGHSAKPGHGSWSGVVQHRKRYEANCPACASFVARQKEVVQKAKPTRGKSPVRPYSQEQTNCPDCAKCPRDPVPRFHRACNGEGFVVAVEDENDEYCCPDCLGEGAIEP